MILVLDGFNVLYKFPEFEEMMVRGQLEPAMRGLIQYMSPIKKSYPKMEIHIFFDGRRSKGDDTFRDFVGGIHVYYSIDESADYLIKEFVESKFGGEQVRVVSSDKQVRHSAKIQKCELQSSEDFAIWYNKVNTPKRDAIVEKPNGGLNKSEVDGWISFFKKERAKKAHESNVNQTKSHQTKSKQIKSNQTKSK